MPDTTRTPVTQDDQPIQFPRGLARPHHARDWFRSVESACAKHSLTDVIHYRLPKGKFAKLHSAEACTLLDPPPADAPFKDKLSYRTHRDKIEERVKQNELVSEQRADWWLKNNHALFVLISDTMKHTAPQIHEYCRDRFEVEAGYFDGYATLEYIKAYLVDLAKRHPQFNVYESAAEVIVKKRLPPGCSEPEFSSVARRFIFDINPFQRAPLTGEVLGEFIITKIMPDYPEAADRLIDTLREKGELDDHEKVVDGEGR